MEYASLTARSMAWWSQPMSALRRLRLEIHLSQCEFAARLGVSEQTYRTWDSGRRRPPRAVVYQALQRDGGRKASVATSARNRISRARPHLAQGGAGWTAGGDL